MDDRVTNEMVIRYAEREAARAHQLSAGHYPDAWLKGFLSGVTANLLNDLAAPSGYADTLTREVLSANGKGQPALFCVVCDDLGCEFCPGISHNLRLSV